MSLPELKVIAATWHGDAEIEKTAAGLRAAGVDEVVTRLRRAPSPVRQVERSAVKQRQSR
ncbi:MAG: hypothetical protein ACT4P3_14590 [Betaproteobacteria bacterium]